MTALVRFENDEGSPIVFEVDEYDFGMERVSRGGDAIVQAGRRIEDILAGVRPALGTLMTALKDLGPSEHEIEFGVKLNVQAGAIIAKTSAEGHFVVKLRWKKDT